MSAAAVLTARLGAWRWPLRGAALGAMGVTTGLGQVPFGLWPLTVLGLVALFLAHRAAVGWRPAALTAFAFGTGYFAVTLHWIVEPFFVDADRYGWMAPFAIVLMATGMALFWAAAAGLAARIAPARVLPLVIALALAEMARALVLTGFPWVLIGHIWIGTPVAQAAAWGGPHLLTLATLLLAAVVLWAGLSLRLAAPVGALAAAWLALDPGPVPVPAADAPVVRMVQPNARQDLKWQPGMAQVFFERSVDLTSGPVAATLGGGPPDLVVWPETSIQWLLDAAAEPLGVASDAAGGAPVVVGILRRDGPRIYNSLAVVAPGGLVTALYDKAHLVPFGEYMPFGEIAARFGIHGLAATDGGGFSAGPGPSTVELPGIGAAVPLICYEGIFSEEVNAAPGRARLLMLITNDGWFGTWAGPEQHFALSRLRAIEQGLPLVRVANTGITAMIDGRGRVTAHLPPRVEAALDAPLPQALPPTAYARLGDGPVAALLVVLAAAAALRGRPQRV